MPCKARARARGGRTSGTGPQATSCGRGSRPGLGPKSDTVRSSALPKSADIWWDVWFAGHDGSRPASRKGGGEKRARILVPSHPSIHPSIPLSFVRSLGTVEILRSVHPVPGAATKVGRPQPAGTPRMDPSWQGNDSTTNGGRRRPVPPVVLGAESESVPPVRPGGSATPGPGPRKASRAAAIRHILRWLAAPHAAVAHLSSVAEEEPFWWWLSRVERRL